MKVEQRDLPFSTVFLVAGLALVGAFSLSADAFASTSPTRATTGAGGGPHLVLPRSSGSSLQLSSCRDDPTCFEASPRGRTYRDRQRQHAEEAFRDLQRELEDINEKRARPDQGRPLRSPSYYSAFGGPVGVPVDGEAAKKWVEKAFDLASEFNGDFAATPKERNANDEFLRKSRKWAEQLVQSTTATDDDNVASETGSTKINEGGGSSSSYSPQSADKNKSYGGDNVDDSEPATEIPNMENTSDEETFRVAVDLPGVEKDGVDVTVEDDFLIVRGTRFSRNRRFTDAAADAGQKKPAMMPRKYEKKIAFVESEVVIEEMEAKFENGVLVVSAPKKKEDPPPSEAKRRIPIV